MTKIELLKQLYNLAKSIKVGNTFVCPSCGTSEIKKHYNQAFCKSKEKTKCKDYYWNNVDESKRNNVDRPSLSRVKFVSKRNKELGKVLNRNYTINQVLKND
jgi:hypothetical protein